ncbi:MAG TPA: hypothetical protein VFX49_12145 [Chloroflexota bacterium]|nr:hypothetical protein [Chloroflexota bacterium]
MPDAAPTGWHVTSLELAAASEHLARTEALWQDVAAGRAGATLRWYSYDRPALVLGVGQRAEDLSRDKVRAHGIDIVKRSSGGTTVLANRDMLALDVAVPAPPGAIFADVVESYRWLGDAALRGLLAVAPTQSHRLTLVAPDEARDDQAAQRFAPELSPGAMRARACFGVLSPYEVALVDPGVPPRKLVGLSQVRKRGVVLYQAGMYLRFTGASLAPYLVADALPLAHELDRRVAALDSLSIANEGAVIDALTHAIAAAMPQDGG